MNPNVNINMVVCHIIQHALTNEGVSDGSPIPIPKNPTNLRNDTPELKSPPLSVSSLDIAESLRVIVLLYESKYGVFESANIKNRLKSE